MNIATLICLQALIVASTVLYGVFRQDYDEIKMGVLQNRVAHLSAVILAMFAYYIGAPLEALLFDLRDQRVTRGRVQQLMAATYTKR